jgi:hypothetical protein
MAIKYESHSIFDRENSASEYDTTPSHNYTCMNHIHSVIMIYAPAVNSLHRCMVIEYESDSIFRLGKSNTASEYTTTQ